MRLFFGRLLVASALALGTVALCAQQEQPLNFGVINQRSVGLTAQAWNPILTYVSKKSGVPLALKMGKTAPETTAMTERGEHAFAYTNHMFTPARDKLGYKAILRLRGEPIHGAIVVRGDSPVRAARDLDGQKVAFPSREAFVGYWLPMDHLLKTGVKVKPVFAGNQEGAMAQLQVGQVAAAAVNLNLLEKYAKRESFSYRVIWTSEPYLDIPVMAHPALSPATVEAVRSAFLGIDRDPEGRKALQDSATALEAIQLWSFVPVADKDYDNYRRFYLGTSVKAE